MTAAIADPTIWAFVAILAVLASATVIVATSAAALPGASTKQIGLRIRTWWWITLIAALAFAAGFYGVLALVGIVSFLALKEFMSLVPARASDHYTLFWVYAVIPLQGVFVAANFYTAFVTFVPVYVFACLSLCMVLRGGPQGFLRAVGVLFWGVMAAVYGLSHIAALWNFQTGGAGLVLFLLLLAQFNDVAQFCCGKLFGRRRIVPRISPNKTWGGFVGGLVSTTVLASVLAPWMTPFSALEAVAAGALIAAAGFAGDIVISGLKRDVGVKDSGHLLPGHGGILDRVDSLVLSAPLFFHFTRFLYVQ